MQLTVNGELREVAECTTVASLIAAMALQPLRVAVERNERLVPRARFAETTLQPGDQVEIVTLVGGG